MDYGSIIKAAERLYLSQPSISAGLKALEEELGAALFDRSGPANRPLRLTPAGQRFYHRAQAILNQCETARAEFAGESAGVVKIRLGILNTLPQAVVTETIRLLAEYQIGIQVNCWEGSTSRLAGWFAQERVDILWGNVSDLTPHVRVLWREPLMAVVRPDHAYASVGTAISVLDLGREAFIHRTHCELDTLGRSHLKAAGIKLDVRVRAEREELAFQLVRIGHGITLAPKSLVPPDLIAVTVVGLNIERSIGLQWRESTDPSVLAALMTACEAATQAKRN